MINIVNDIDVASGRVPDGPYSMGHFFVFWIVNIYDVFFYVPILIHFRVEGIN